jgi:hypothetical protein
MASGSVDWPTTRERAGSANLDIISFVNTGLREIPTSRTDYVAVLANSGGTNVGCALVESRVPVARFGTIVSEKSPAERQSTPDTVANTFVSYVRSFALTTTSFAGMAVSSPNWLLPEQLTAYQTRIEYLRADGEIDGVEIMPSSEGDFWEFVNMVPEWEKASLILVDDGNLRAVWRKPGKDRINVEFLGDGVVEVAIFEGGQIPEAYERRTIIEAIKNIQEQGLAPV